MLNFLLKIMACAMSSQILQPPPIHKCKDIIDVRSPMPLTTTKETPWQENIKLEKDIHH